MALRWVVLPAVQFTSISQLPEASVFSASGSAVAETFRCEICGTETSTALPGTPAGSTISTVASSPSTGGSQ